MGTKWLFTALVLAIGLGVLTPGKVWGVCLESDCRKCVGGIPEYVADGTPCNTDDQDVGLKCDGEYVCRSGSCLEQISPIACMDDPLPGACVSSWTCSDQTMACSPAYANATTVCRAAAGSCDSPEFCGGTSKDCPADDFKNAGTVCRGAQGECDQAEVCTGQSASCPVDKKVQDGTLCSSDGLFCTGTEKCQNGACTSMGGACFDDPYSCTTTCNESRDQCNTLESGNCLIGGVCYANGDENPLNPCQVCNPANPMAWSDKADGTPLANGDGKDCTDDICKGGQPYPRTAAGTVCRAAAGSCDQAETCNGTDETCPGDGLKASSTVCRAAAGVCDRAETCTGASASCPADGFLPATTVCNRGSGDLCDPDERCTSTGASCPTDVILPSSAVCRPAADSCDLADYCPGTADQGCPVDARRTQDRDGDLTPDCRDQCPDDGDKSVPGTCGCGVSDVNTDGDSKVDCQESCDQDAGKLEPGQCGCGTADTDSDGDGVANCSDGCPSDAAKTAPGVCGCGVMDVLNACGTCGALIVEDPSVLKVDPSLETGLVAKIDFDSQSDYLDLGTDGFDFPRPNPTTGAGGFTVAFWMKTEQKAGSSSIGLVGRDGNDATGRVPESEWEINIPNDGGSRDKIRFRVFDNGEDSNPDNDQSLHLTGQSVTSDGRWHHVVARRNVLSGGAGEAQSEFCLIIDGGTDTDCRTRTFQSPLRNDGTVLVGALRSPDLQTIQEASLYQGTLDDLRLYNRALSDEELAALIAKPGDRCDRNQDSCATARLECDTSDPTTTTLTCPAETDALEDDDPCTTEEPEETGEPEPETTTPAEEPSVEPALEPVEPTSAPISDPAPLPLEPAPVLPVPVVAGDPVDTMPEPIPAPSSSKALLPICFCIEDDLEAICGSEGEKIPLDGPCPRLSDQEVVEPEMTAFTIEVNRYMSDPSPNVLRESLMPRLADNIDQWVDGKTAHPIHVLRIQAEEATGQVGEIIDPAVKDRIREHFEIRKEGSLAPREDSPEPPVLFSPGSVHYKNPEPVLPSTPSNPTGNPQDPSEPVSDADQTEDREQERGQGESPRDGEKDREKKKEPHGRVLGKEKAMTLTVNDQPKEYLLQPVGHAHVEGGGCSLIRDRESYFRTFGTLR